MKYSISIVSRPRWSVLVPVIAVAALGCLVPVLMQGVVALGHNIPQQEDIARDYVSAVVWAILLGGSILMWPVSAKNKVALLWVWGAKVLVMLGFMLLYEYYYNDLDAYSYYSLPRHPSFYLDWNQAEAGTQAIYGLVWLLQQFLPESYHLLKVSFGMVGLVGVYLCYRAAVIFLQREELRLFYCLALFPSVLFWSSIVGKDPVVLFSMGLYVYGVVGLHRLKQLRYSYSLVLGIGLALCIRMWLGLILLVPLTIFVFGSMRGIGRRIVAGGAIGIALFLIWAQIVETFRFSTTEELFAALDLLSRSWAYDGGSGQVVSADFTNLSGILTFIPLGAFTALFRPLPGEVMNPFGFLAGLENAFLLGLLWLAMKRGRWRDMKDPLLVSAIVLIVAWSILYGFVSYQNLGTAVRFKAQILPVLLFVLLFFSQQSSARFSLKATPVGR